MKSNSVITHYIDGITGIITFTVLGAGTLEFDPRKAHADNRTHAAGHGFVQRVSDAAAISRNPITGKPATPQQKYDAMAQLIAHYESGASEWSRVRAGDGSPKGQTFRALCLVYPNRSPEEIKTWFSGLSKEHKAAVRGSQKVRDAIATFTDTAKGDAILGEWDSE